MPVVDFIHALAFDDLPPAVRSAAQRCLLDLVGVAAAGRKTDLARIALNHANCSEQILSRSPPPPTRGRRRARF